MKRKFCFLLFLCPGFWVTAQVKSATGQGVGSGLASLNIGDQVPALRLSNVLNHKGQSLDFADFRGKLLILDFWATSCGSCIQAMPRLDSLQHLFGDRLVILPVTYEKAARIRAFQQHNGYLKGLQFRTVVEDRDLHRLFPHRLLPHEVWISATGKVLGFTEVTEVNEALIRKVLAGGSLTAPDKVDVLDYDPSRPLLIQNNGAPDTAYRYRSLITARIKGLPAAIRIQYDSVRRQTTVRATNVSVRRLYGLAYKQLRSLPDSVVTLGQDRGLWCYELTMPGHSAALIRQCIREDLDRFFQVRSAWSGHAFRLVPLPAPDDPDDALTL